jgi:hypothetical protein
MNSHTGMKKPSPLFARNHTEPHGEGITYHINNIILKHNSHEHYINCGIGQ